MNVPPKIVKRQFVTAERLGVGNPGPAPDPVVVTQTPRTVGQMASAPVVKTTESRVATRENVTESLPVLEAFHTFLEQERRHSRRQIMAVTIFFFVILIFVVAGGIFVGSVFVRQTGEDLKSLEKDFAQLKKESKNTVAGSQEALEKILVEAENLRKSMTQSEAAIKAAKEEVAASLQNREAELLRLQNLMAVIGDENKLLKADLARLKPRQAEEVLIAVKNPVEPVSRPQTTTQVVQKTIPAEKKQAERIEFAIVPEGRTGPGINWRIPISE